VDRQLADTARLARDCLWLHSGWISAYLGKQPVQNPTAAVVRLHLAPAHGSKGGASLGAAFLGEADRPERDSRAVFMQLLVVHVGR
jgi:hypothetical protein